MRAPAVTARVPRAILSLTLVAGAASARHARAQEPADAPMVHTALVGTTWRLVAIDGRPLDPDLPPVTLNVRSARFEGSGGCNWYTAWLEEHAGTVAVSHLAATGRDCLHPRIMELETRYLAYLEGFRVHRWTGYVLALMADEKESGWLLFTRPGAPGWPAPERPPPR
jgi:heat shock protein HslJ